MPRFSSSLLLVWILGICLPVRAADEARPEAKKPKTILAARTVEQIAEQARKSVAVITFAGRNGNAMGLGTGFVVGSDGLIATNLHVLGEARAIAVRLADGKTHDVTSVYASDRALDLAVVRIKARGLPALKLADSAKLKLGQAVVALGNPHGLEYSVVSGVVSAIRPIMGRSMIQLAIPVEPGNSGGPLLDRHGRVQGILTLKSVQNANIAFAMPINALKPLLDKPNPIPMSRWLTIGALDPREWQPLFGAHWRQRAGRILVEGAGAGFGGRSLCLARCGVPPVPFEVAVSVKLGDEAGAAGLVWHSDGDTKHYGFYPSAGRLRLTRFEGKDVFTWKVLWEKKCPAYHSGDWNTLKVRVEKDKTICYVNDRPVYESADNVLTGGKVGLVKFRDTRAEFKAFHVAKQIPPAGPTPELAARLRRQIEKLPLQDHPTPAAIDPFLPEANTGAALLRERAQLLEKQAAQLRALANAVHAKKVQTDLAKALRGPEEKIDLVHAALLVAQLDNAELDVAAYRTDVDRLGRELAAALPKGADDPAKLAALAKFLFRERGFHGSRVAYYTRANSYLNEVLDDREGIPITLTLLYVELAHRIGLNVAGVGMPGHFIAKYVPAQGPERLIDVYDGGTLLDREEAGRIVKQAMHRPLKNKDLAAVTKQAVIVRMLQNLFGVAQREKDNPGALRYLDTILAIAPDSAYEHWLRAVYRYQAGVRAGALEDTDWILAREPKGIDLQLVHRLRRLLIRPEE
jgi:regulator of sirC expression with transglutaminase-like and TPR domain